jgi:hypothetical protein
MYKVITYSGVVNDGNASLVENITLDDIVRDLGKTDVNGYGIASIEIKPLDVNGKGLSVILKGTEESISIEYTLVKDKITKSQAH